MHQMAAGKQNETTVSNVFLPGDSSLRMRNQSENMRGFPMNYRERVNIWRKGMPFPPLKSFGFQRIRISFSERWIQILAHIEWLLIDFKFHVERIHDFG